MNNLRTIVAPFQNEPKELLRYLCNYVNDQMLEEISQADYGFGADAYLKELKKIKQNKYIHKMQFDAALAEVVELTRWGKPVQTKDKRITKVQEGNLAIAFSCTILLMVPRKWYHNRIDESRTIIHLIQSIEYLNHVFSKSLDNASQLLAWRITENSRYSDEIPFFILGLIIILLKKGDYHENQVVDLIEKLLIIRQKECRAFNKRRTSKSSPSLFENKLVNQSEEMWLSYQPFLIKQVDEVKSEQLKDRLKRLVSLIF